MIVGVAVGVAVGVTVGVTVAVTVGVLDGVAVGVCVGVGVGVVHTLGVPLHDHPESTVHEFEHPSATYAPLVVYRPMLMLPS